MEQNDLISTMAVYVELMAEQEPKPEMEQQLKLVVEYRHMVKNINTEHMKQQIKEELHIKILREELSVGTVPTVDLHPVGTVPMVNMHPVGTLPMLKFS